MSKKEEKVVSVNRSDLEALRDKALEYDLVLESTLKDHYNNNYILPDVDIIIVLELAVSCKMMVTYLDDVFIQPGEKVELLLEEVHLITNLLKMLNVAMDHNMSCGTNLLRH